MLLFVEQILNGLQLGIFLFLVAAGLTLIFGIMGLINLAHGSLFMIGAYVAATVTAWTGSFVVGLLATLPATALAGIVIEFVVMRRLYDRDHLDQVLATFGLILFINEAVTMIWGRTPLFLNVPDALKGSVEIIPGVPYPVYRIAIIAAGILVALILWAVITRTRAGMLIRAGSTNREMVAALGVDIALLYTALFAAGAVFAGFAGAMAGPLVSVQVGMGEQILILAFVTIVIGGIGSIRGALIGSLLVGLVDTLGRAFVPDLLKLFLPPAEADGIGAGLSSMMVYLLMALVLIIRPSGLFPTASGAR
ncbi:branched-chain amino acid ABC transporter permease [Microbaculum sp. FT89]|uniref:branched-chain amino acid ABC transporter permease n=1 Tax=Microbaculum sp. FT89 TaxID=3447298 RepID=UPI003F5386B3